MAWHLEWTMSVMGQAAEASCRLLGWDRVCLGGREELAWWRSRNRGGHRSWERESTSRLMRVGERGGLIDLGQEILLRVYFEPPWLLWASRTYRTRTSCCLCILKSSFPLKSHFLFQEIPPIQCYFKAFSFYNANPLGSVEKVMSIFHLCVN